MIFMSVSNLMAKKSGDDEFGKITKHGRFQRSSAQKFIPTIYKLENITGNNYKEIEAAALVTRQTIRNQLKQPKKFKNPSNLSLDERMAICLYTLAGSHGFSLALKAQLRRPNKGNTGAFQDYVDLLGCVLEKIGKTGSITVYQEVKNKFLTKDYYNDGRCKQQKVHRIGLR